MLRFLTLFLLFIFSCQVVDNSADELDVQLAALKSDADKKNYLEEIFKEDQKYRQGQSAQILQQYPKTSQRYLEFMRKFDTNDSLNLAKVERYLTTFGYPNIEKHGELAAQTPWAVIHHCPDYEKRAAHFKTLHKAYKDRNIDGGAFSLYLERMYSSKFRQQFRIEGNYQPQVMIDSLIEILNLDPSK